MRVPRERKREREGRQKEKKRESLLDGIRNLVASANDFIIPGRAQLPFQRHLSYFHVRQSRRVFFRWTRLILRELEP